jgi:hypothetical protein
MPEGDEPLFTLCCQFLWIALFFTAPSVFSNFYLLVLVGNSRNALSALNFISNFQFKLSALPIFWFWSLLQKRLMRIILNIYACITFITPDYFCLSSYSLFILLFNTSMLFFRWVCISFWIVFVQFIPFCIFTLSMWMQINRTHQLFYFVYISV